ncbi:MAG: acyl-CoA dehydrogenase [Parvibaculum sp.]|jgi:(2S)-methylsuccinyl-CoA dehydrogenase|uniref:acyl-CoA dehydrogenase family protein n=1 Tax=Parvibaculum sp. TaxID=2024848 RepID=UPI000C4ED56E|nr:acyl-CoA dehydrogenase family protein [Parvibaculum sp.]MAU60870.1 acyl-CoA dehydrogenase [Parvibaculum sp.]|tara:strand:- start:864 stop:2567 length:1704 start_codon:yes stop_codon:yes gene_type:complete
MSQSNAAAASAPTGGSAALLDDLLPSTVSAVEAADALFAKAKAAVFAKVAKDGKVSAALIEKEQFAVHGLAWFATYVEALRQLASYAARMTEEGRFGEFEALIVQAAFGEYLSQIAGGIPMSQGETVRMRDLGVTHDEAQVLFNDAVRKLVMGGNTAPVRARLAELIAANTGAATFGDAGLEDTYEQIRDQMRKFADAEVVPHAHEWHLKDDYIPLDVVAQMSELGVFGLTIPEEFGGLGLGKESMCVVSEELSRGYIGVGSLGTRSEIAAELILGGGTAEQKQKWLPKIASGEVLPTAVFTEPNTGSDLASLKTRGKRDGDVYKVNGNKTWITHAARADVMTLLCRTNDEPGYKGLSMLLAEKPRGDDNDPFPAKGMSGGEIEVLGYRGMKEFEIGFDDFEVKAENLLGGEEGQGFKQLMQTFESARIQTAARAVGVAQCALELGLRYAQERVQFGKPIMSFPRVFGKLVMMAVEIMVARQITYFAAREKDGGRRCDLEAGMAKLLAARVAWAAADNALQIHGGNGFALEYPVSRVLCDARILNIFEGAAEIQAQVIARRLLEGGN